MSTPNNAHQIDPVQATADVVLFSNRYVLLIKRGHAPFAGQWALPGGRVDHGEEVPKATVRELGEETDIDLPVTALREVGVYDTPGRDPRGHFVSTAYTATLPEPTGHSAGDDASEARWWPLDNLPPLAFDHARIIADALHMATRPDPAAAAAKSRDRRIARRLRAVSAALNAALTAIGAVALTLVAGDFLELQMQPWLPSSEILAPLGVGALAAAALATELLRGAARRIEVRNWAPPGE